MPEISFDTLAAERIEAARESGTKILDLSGLGLTVLPEAIGDLTALETLDVSQNKLTALPEACSTLLAEFAQPANLAAGANRTRTESILLPELVDGDYHIVVISDADDELFEHVNEDNNPWIGVARAARRRRCPFAARESTRPSF